MHSLRNLLLGTLSMATLAIVTSCSTTGDPEPPSNFDIYDTNGDGVLRVAEMEAALSERLFREGDQNADGVVTFEEWQSVLPSADASMFNRYAVGGRMTLAQAKVAIDQEGILDKLMSSTDTNADGVVDQREARIFRNALDANQGANDVQKLKSLLSKGEGI